jgi:hypothetical protein
LPIYPSLKPWEKDSNVLRKGIQLTKAHTDVNAVAAHIGGEDLEQGDVANRVNVTAHRGE